MRKTIFIVLALACLFAGSARAQTTVNCGQPSKDIITAAQFYTAGELSDALNYISAMRSGGDSARFVRWFGSTDAAIVDRVAKTLDGVYRGLTALPYNCDCRVADAIAYADLNASQIVLCRPYFDSFGMGAMTMSTVVHEISHFLGTRDCMKPLSSGECCYGVNKPGGCSGPDEVPNTPERARMFATSSPDLASRNAYNIGWFVSNGQ